VIIQYKHELARGTHTHHDLQPYRPGPAGLFNMTLDSSYTRTGFLY